jgi:signal recognition particle GTPase
MRPDFSLDDFMSQMAQVKRLGAMGKLMGLIPGMQDMMKQVKLSESDIDRSLNRMRAVYNSMTRAEREDVDLLDARRRARIARGAGCDVADVRTFVTNFEQSRAMMRAVGNVGLTGKHLGRRRMDWVAGLVTLDPARPDPSTVRRDERADRSARHLGLGLFLAFGAVCAAVYWLASAQFL